jgi:Fic family protein
MTSNQTSISWAPIADLPSNWQELAVPELPPLFHVWNDQASHLRESHAFKEYLLKMRREIAIETGIIERLYTLDRGVTQLLIEYGLDEALIPHGATDKPPRAVIELIRDQEFAIEGLFDFVAQRRPLSTSYIKELHATLTQHQATTEAMTTNGDVIEVELRRGEWKTQPNNPTRPDGVIHEYCPPEHVSSEMDNLVRWHLAHQVQGVPPEIEAAWLHHRFTQIHPFQDGNGRVARCLATLVFLKAEWFPLVLRDSDRAAYINALEKADGGNLRDLISLFAQAERQAFIRSISLSEEVLSENRQSRAIISAVGTRIRKKRELQIGERIEKVERFAEVLFDVAKRQLERVRDEIATELKMQRPGGRPIADVFPNANGSEHADWRGWQINQAANRLGYFANRRDYSAWVQLRIYYKPITDILFSFHVPGPKYLGVLVCSACAYRNSENEDAGRALMAYDLEILSDAPFQFSYADEENEVKRRFDQWADSVIVAGLKYWQQEV